MTEARTSELNRIMRDHSLTCRQVGELLNRDLRTVRNWRAAAGATIPEHALQLLRAKLAKAEADA